MSDPKTLLLDLQKELQGTLLSEVIELRGRKFLFRLLNEAEMGWTLSFIKKFNEISIALSARLATLAVGIRSIDGVPTEDLFADQWNALSEFERKELLDEHSEKKFAISNMFFKYLSEMPPDFISELHEHWQKLEVRRTEAQGEVKNS